MLQSRAIEIATRPSTIVIVVRQARPALVTLTSDERLARLPLGLQRVELLLQALFRGFAGIDRAAQEMAGSSRFFIHARSQPAVPRGGLLTPKKRGPDHDTPVIRRAIRLNEE